MKLEKLIQLTLQYLEVDSELNTSEYSINDLKQNDTFSEYLNNIEHTIYTGISRLAESEILPIQEIQLAQQVTSLKFTSLTVKNSDAHSSRTINTSEKIFTRIKEVYALDSNSRVIHNVPYTLIGAKLIISYFNSDYTYFVVYHPNVMYLDNYIDLDETIYDVELSNLKVTDSVLGNVYVDIPDAMAINLKYMVYSDIKLEDNPSIANINKNYFESYISECKNNAQTQNYQVEVNGIDYGDRYGEKQNQGANSNPLCDYLYNGGDD